MSASQTRIQRHFSLSPSPESESAAGSGFSTDSWSDVDGDESQGLQYLMDVVGGERRAERGEEVGESVHAGQDERMGGEGGRKEAGPFDNVGFRPVPSMKLGDSEGNHTAKGKERVPEEDEARHPRTQDLSAFSNLFEDGIYDSEDEAPPAGSHIDTHTAHSYPAANLQEPAIEPTPRLSIEDQLKLFQNTLYHHHGQLLAHLTTQSNQIRDLQKEVGNLKTNATHAKPPAHPLRPLPGISPEDVTELATSLATGEIDGYQAAEKMFNWVEKCNSLPKLNEGRDTLEPMVRVGNLEGVLDVTLGRVGRLEKEVEGLKSELMDAEIGTVMGDDDYRGVRGMSMSGVSNGGDDDMTGMSGSQGSVGGQGMSRNKRAKMAGYGDGGKGKSKVVQRGFQT